jgi:hypothetical protein
MSDPRRQITLTLSGQAVRDGKVSVRLLSRKLEATQQALWQIGRAKIENDPSRRGPPPTLVQRQCELFFSGARPGSLAATLELPPPEASLFPGFAEDVGEEALQDLRAVIKGVIADDAGEVGRVIPNTLYRKRVLTTISILLPPQGSDYDLTLQVGEEPPFSGIVRPTHERLRALSAIPEAIDVELPPEETWVQVVARARVRPDAELRPRDIVDVVEWEQIEAPELRPYRASELSWGGRRIRLRHEIACGVSQEDGLYVIEYEPLAIRAYAQSREDAIRDFNEEFIVLWDQYANTPDQQLTADAVSLKRRLGELVLQEVRTDEG